MNITIKINREKRKGEWKRGSVEQGDGGGKGRKEQKQGGGGKQVEGFIDTAN